jgi:NAD(P)-dependent dehydrogenase (short-subunit alcohol dehydrogenase family)
VIDYGAAKAGLLNVVKALSQELGPKGILKPEAIRSRLGSG